MQKDGHLETAVQLEKSARQLLFAPEEHVKAIVELIFGSAHHYIAHGLDVKYGEHSDDHTRDAGVLRRVGELDIAQRFESLDRLRAGRFYGRKGNGETVAECIKLLEEIKTWSEKGTKD